MQGGGLRGGNDPLGGTARWPHAPGGLPSAYDQAFHRAVPGSKVAPLSLTLAVTLSPTLAVTLSLTLAVTLILTLAVTRALTRSL